MRRVIAVTAAVVIGVAGVAARADAQQLPPPPPEPESEFLPEIERQQQSVAFVSQTRAYRYTTPVRIYPGRNTTIEFRTDEAITFVQLSDLSEIVYETNAPLPSGQAKVIVLRQIRPLDIEGTTNSAIPNLTVSTVDRQGNLRTYTFNLLVRDGALAAVPVNDKTNGVAIVPNQQAEAERLALRRNEQGLQFVNTRRQHQHNTLETQMGTATLGDIKLGLQVAIERGYTPSDDPVVYNVQQTLAIARNGTPLQQAMQQTQVGQEVMVELGEIGIESAILSDKKPSYQQQVEQEI